MSLGYKNAYYFTNISMGKIVEGVSIGFIPHCVHYLPVTVINSQW